MFIYNFYSFTTHSQLSWYGIFVMHTLPKREGEMPQMWQTWLWHSYDMTNHDQWGKLKWNCHNEYRNAHTPSPSACTLQLPPLQQCEWLGGTMTPCHTNDSMCNGTNDKWRMTEQLAMMRDMRTDKVNSEGSKVCPAFLLFTSYFLSYYFTNHPPGAQPHNNNTTAATPLPQLPPPHPTWSSFKCTVLCAMICLWCMFPFLRTHVFCCLYGNLP